MKYLLFIIPIFISTLSSEVARCNDSDNRKFDNAVSYYKSNPSLALQIADSLLQNDEESVPRWKVLGLQSNIYLQLRDITKTIQIAQKADSIYQSTFHRPYSEAHSILGIAYKDRGDLPLALIHYQIAVDSSPDTLSRVTNLFNMAEIELVSGDTITATNHLKSNSQYIKSLRNSGFKGYSYLQYGRFISAVGRSETQALSYFIQAATLLENCKEFQSAGFSCTGAAKMYVRLNRPDSCRWWFNKALELQKKSNNPLGLADVYMNIAEYELSLNHDKAALDLFLTALPLAQKANYLPLQENILKQLAVAYEKSGDYFSGIKYLRKYNKLKDSIDKQQWIGQLSEIQTKYAVKQKDQQLEKLQEKANNLIGFPWLILGGGILLLGSSWAGIRLAAKKKNRKNITETIPQQEVAKIKTLSKDRKELWLKLEYALESEKLFHDPNLTLSGLSKYLNTNRSTLSEVINYYGNKSFNNLINQYRVKEACKLLCDPAFGHLSIEGIGSETGFKSRSAFYAAFHSVMGETPSSYRKNRSI